MTPKAYKTTVGAFVVLAILLFTAGIVLLGGGRLFTESLKYVLYFDGSVSGLAIGAPVVFRGVPMGSVTEIRLVANARDSNVTIPVTIRIDDRSFMRASGQSLSEDAQAEIIRRMVERGLRARLQLASLITGQYRVELDFFPNTPMNFRSSNPQSEIPTIPSPIDTLQRAFTRLPIEQMVDSLSAILSNITDAVGQGQLKAALDEFTGAFKAAREFLTDSPVFKSLEGSLAQVNGATETVRQELPGALLSFQRAMASLARAADELRRVADSADDAIGRDSPTMNDLRRMLKEITAAARALRNFTDMLERNPEALLKGRQGTR
ncbi:MAG: MCE family protein [Desulfovibrio sp.]|nr:MCE family protein [Desulfovibrio sp.]